MKLPQQSSGMVLTEFRDCFNSTLIFAIQTHQVAVILLLQLY